MLTIKAGAKPSKIQGIGLFADEKIKKGTITWKFNPRFDILFDPKKVERMPTEQRELIDHYAYLSAKLNKYVFSLDDSRFTNHSSKKNNIDSVLFPGEIESCGVANRDIEKGEELLANYCLFDSHDGESEDKYLES